MAVNILVPAAVVLGDIEHHQFQLAHQQITPSQLAAAVVAVLVGNPLTAQIRYLVQLHQPAVVVAAAIQARFIAAKMVVQVVVGRMQLVAQETEHQDKVITVAQAAVLIRAAAAAVLAQWVELAAVQAVTAAMVWHQALLVHPLPVLVVAVVAVIRQEAPELVELAAAAMVELIQMPDRQDQQILEAAAVVLVTHRLQRLVETAVQE